MNTKIINIAAAIVMGAASATAQYTWDPAHLDRVASQLSTPYYAPAYESLMTAADSLLDAAPLTVMMKDKTAASGDRHDYLSQARYSWPDPTKPDGLPYINRDGVSNPELERLDRVRLGKTAGRVATLALAYRFSGDEKYAAKATQLIRAWFLDRDTRMNPNLEYAQVVWGQNGNKGRCYGLIDSYSFVDLLNGVALLEGSRSFTPRDSKKLRQWFRDFTKWMLTSQQGIDEGKAQNNHGVAYDAQMLCYALYTGDTALARKIAEAVPERRVFKQIMPDGSQPHELKRTLAFHYSNYNLGFFIDLATMASKLGIDLTQAVSPEGASIGRAADFLAVYVGKDAPEWPYQQISGMQGAKESLGRNLYRLAALEGKAFNAPKGLPDSSLFKLTHIDASMADQAYAHAGSQLRLLASEADKARKEQDNAARRRVEPRSLKPDGSLAMIHPHDWCSGFFPGSLWLMYDYTGKPCWRELAISWTWPIEEAKWHRGTHDLGFMINDSFGKAYELTGEQSYRDVVVQAARTLSTRFNPTVGCIRSWDHNRDRWAYPVIIDNLMNLEMLFRATQLTGDSTYYNIAVSHADVTMKNHFRDDFSSFHVVDYDPSTGAVRGRCTHQGFADDSFWSRGQAWGLYGYATCYRFTGDRKYLRQSEAIADFILGLPNMPADGVPYWDMKIPGLTDRDPATPNPDVPRDASAAAIIASGLYELAGYVEPAKGGSYRAAADHILASLHAAYEAPAGSSRGFVLLHSTGHAPAKSEVDVPLNYADYYYLEALARQAKFKSNTIKK